MRTIGDRLKEQRQRAGLTQSQAAELEGLSRQYIWKLEEGVSPHSLRRTFAVFHLRNGVDLYTLARLMGHEDIATLKVYLDLADTDAAEAHRRYTLLDEL